MSTIVNTQTSFFDDTTMVIYRGSRKPIAPERKRELAKRCGISFIPLIFKGNLTSSVGVSGFQHVKLRSQPRKGGGVEPVAQWHLNIFTNQPMAEGSLDFIPDEMGTGRAYLPDSPFNRVRLAYAEIANNALWIIDDKEIYKEICTLAEEIRNSVEYKKAVEKVESLRTEVEMRVQEQNVKIGVEHKTKMEIEIAVLEKRVKEMEGQQKRDELKRRLKDLAIKAELQQPSITNKAVEAVLVDDTEENNNVNEEAGIDIEDIDISPDENTMFLYKKRAKTEVHEKYPELIEDIKKKYLERTGKNRGWGFSPEYLTLIEPKIQERLKEIIAENEHATVSLAD